MSFATDTILPSRKERGLLLWGVAAVVIVLRIGWVFALSIHILISTFRRDAASGPTTP